MTDFQEKKTNDPQNSRTINIEFPAGGFERMFKMMAGHDKSEKSESSCCDMPRDRCCPQPGEDDTREIKIIIKKKEQ